MTSETCTVVTAAQHAGITFRQADHWISLGWIHADRDHPGSGNQRSINHDELRTLVTMGHLVRAGITPARAHGYARTLNAGLPIVLGPGLAIMHVTITPTDGPTHNED